MKNLAPDIFRQRLMLEGFYTIEMSREVVKNYLVGLAHHLHLRTYSDPMIYSPASGMGRDENAGFDAFVPLIDSGISLYVWSQANFFAVVLFTCKGFEDQAAIEFTRDYFGVEGELVSASF